MLCAGLAVRTSTIMSCYRNRTLVLGWDTFSFRLTTSAEILWIPWGAGRLIILQTDFCSCYFSTLLGGVLHSPGYLKSWEVNGCGGSRLGPLIHGWYIRVLTEEKFIMWGIYLIHGYGITQLCIRASVTKWPPADVWRELYNPVKHAYFASCKIVLKC